MSGSERDGGRAVACEIAVVGAGPAGIAAAAMAAELGRDVVLLDAGPRPGGQIWRHRELAELPARARRWLNRLSDSGARFLPGSSVVDVQPVDARHMDTRPVDTRPAYAPLAAGGLELLVERFGEAVSVRAERLILATGARELFLPVPGWTLPNIFGVGGAQALLKAGASFVGKRVVVAGSGPLLLAVAASLREHGARVSLVAEQAPSNSLFRFAAGLWRSPGRLVQAALLRASLGGVRYAAGCWVTAALGDEVVREVRLTDGRRSWTEPCDILCTGYGLVPNTELAELLGCAIEDGRVWVNDMQRTTVERVYCAGEPTGIAGVDAALLEGEIAARAAVSERAATSWAATRSAAMPNGLFGRRRREHYFARRLERTFALRAELRAAPPPGTIICRCEDVAIESLDPGWSFRQAKLYTRIGMGPCQARVCGPACEIIFGRSGNSCRIPSQPAMVSTLFASSSPGGAGAGG